MKALKLTLKALVLFFLPSYLATRLLVLFGDNVETSVKIGFSVILSNKIIMDKGSKIGHFNFIKTKELELGKASFIKNLNYIKGPFSVLLKDRAGISNQNRIRRAYPPVSYGNAILHLGVNTFIVSNHLLDLTNSITIGDNSILAGLGSQIWTHGYYHAKEGSDRVRIDGAVKIGDNVYVGSRCIFNPGVQIGNAIHVGAGSVISKDLLKSGMYVGQALRYIDNDLEKIKSKLVPLDEEKVVENIFVKNIRHE